MCNHNTCVSIRNAGACNSIACVLVNNYNGAKIVIYLGKERGGNYTGQYNLCAGKLEPCDGGCYLKALQRELGEEFKIWTHLGSGN
jgi:8-oxo-dGTP pyrophosphatase MutT (NUDIX family)